MVNFLPNNAVRHLESMYYRDYLKKFSCIDHWLLIFSEVVHSNYEESGFLHFNLLMTLPVIKNSTLFYI